MADDEKKIEIDGPVEIIIGSKEEEKKASSMPTKCRDGEKIYYPTLESMQNREIKNFFIDEFNISTQKGFLTSIKPIEKKIELKKFLKSIKCNECNNIISTPIHCGNPMVISKVTSGKIKLECKKCKHNTEEDSLFCDECQKIIDKAQLDVSLKENKIKRIEVKFKGSKANPIYLCPEGSTFKDLKLSLYKTFKGKPKNFFEYQKDDEDDEEFRPISNKNIYVKFRQFDPKTGKKEVRTSIRIGEIKFLIKNRSWEISPLGLPKGTIRSFLLLMVFWMFLGYFLAEPDKAFHPIQVEVLILLIVVFIPSLLDKLDIKDDYKTGGKLTFLGGAGIFGWLTFQEFFEANTFNLMIAPLFVLVGIALRKAANEVVDNHPESGTKTYLTLLANHLLALGVLTYVGLYVYSNLALGAENIEDIWHIIFAILTSFYVSERLFEQDIKVKATYYPEKAVSSTV